MTAALMEHQREGVAFLIKSRSGLLAFEQGLGKSLVAIDSFCKLRASGEVHRMVVICPNSLKRNWVAEIAKFAPELSVEIAEGPPRTRRLALSSSRADVLVTSYETARIEVTSILALLNGNRAVLVLDESHLAKNWKSLTSVSMRHFAPHCEYRWLLSGTPVTNTPADLYTQIEIVSPGKRALGSLENFLAQVEADPSAAFAKPVLDRLILRRRKEECLDLPDKIFTDVLVELPPWQRKLYDEMKTQMVCDIRAMTGERYHAFATTALAQLTRLSQLASNPALLAPACTQVPGKFEVLNGLVHDILSVTGRKIIIWSTFVQNIRALQAQFSSHGAVAIYGEVDPAERQQAATYFQNDPKVRVMIANPAAAGMGFTLTSANFTIYESMSWRYDHYAQSQDRNHRIGQNQPVSYFRLIAADTIDEAVVRALERKSEMAGDLLSDPKSQNLLSRLAPEEMCKLILYNELPAENG